jgi:glycosyltransferase involved in cell wall biosynthesis
LYDQLITVGIPVHNGEEYIEETINNILNQTYNNVQIIINDNCSTDLTYEICNNLTLRDERIKLYKENTKLNVVDNFKKVFERSSSDFFIYAAVGDKWNPTFLEKMFDVINRDDNCSLVFSDFLIKDRFSDKQIPITISSSNSNSKFIRYLFRVIDIQPHLIYGLFRSKMLNANHIKKMDFFDVNLSTIFAIEGKIKIVHEYLFEWIIDKKRNSYSIDNKTKPSVWKFIWFQLKICHKNFGLIRTLMALIFLLKFITNNIINRFLSPNSFNINFNE